MFPLLIMESLILLNANKFKLKKGLTKMEKLIKLWTKEVNGLKIENILDLYEDNAKLFPTFSPKIIKNKQEIRGYFEKLATYKNLFCEVHEVYQDHLEGNHWKESGLYTFSWVEQNGEKVAYKARFIFVYTKKGNLYRILEHQSNRMPS